MVVKNPKNGGNVCAFSFGKEDFQRRGVTLSNAGGRDCAKWSGEQSENKLCRQKEETISLTQRGKTATETLPDAT